MQMTFIEIQRFHRSLMKLQKIIQANLGKEFDYKLLKDYCKTNYILFDLFRNKTNLLLIE